jgi:integrase
MSVTLRKKKLSSGKYSLYLDIYHNKKREYEFLNLYLDNDRQKNKEILSLAKKIISKREIELGYEDYGLAPAFKRKANFVEYFQNHIATIKKSNTKIAMKSAFNYLNEFTKGFIQFNNIDEKFLRDFQQFLLNKVSPNSANDYYTKVKSVINLALKDKIINNNPGQFLKNIKRQNTKIVYLTSEELSKLANTPCPNNEVKLGYLFSCFTSLRFSDVQALTWDNVTNERMEYRQKKTGKQEYPPLSENVQEILSSISSKRSPNEKVIKLPSHRHANNVLKEWAKVAGINKKLSYQTSRHTFAVILLSNGVPLYTVSKLMGHASIKTTEIYADIVNEARELGIAAFPKIHFQL